MYSGHAPTAWYYTSVLMAAGGGSVQFYHMNVLNGMHSYVNDWMNSTFTDRDPYLTSPSASYLSVYWSLVSSIAVVGGLVGSLSMRWLADHIGRRNGLLLNSLAAICGAVACGVAKYVQSPELLVIGRLMVGFAVGVVAGLVPMYLTEISPISRRGAAGSAHMVAIAFGDLISLVVGLPWLLGSDMLWPVACLLPAIPAVFLICVLPFCPESPRYLLSVDRLVEAKRCMRQLVPTRHRNSLSASGTTNSDEFMSEDSTFLGTVRCIWRRPALRLPLLLSVLVMLAQQSTGNVAVFLYSTQIFEKASLSPSAAQTGTALIGLAYFLSVCVSVFLIERVGRRPLLLCQLMACSVDLGALAVATAVSDMQPTAKHAGIDWVQILCIACLVMYMAAYGVGCSVPWLIASELFEQRYRATAVTLSTLVSFGFGIVNAFGYVPWLHAVGVSWSLVPYMLSQSVCTTLLWRYLPETKGKSIHEITEHFQSRISHNRSSYRAIA